MLLEETISDVADHTFFEHFLKVLGNFLTQSHALFPLSHQIFNLLEVVFGPVVLLLLHHLDASPTIVGPDVFDEVSSIADKLTLDCVNEGA